MLARNFMSAEALGINEIELNALIRVLGMLERGEIEYAKSGYIGDMRGVPKPRFFNMYYFVGENDCGTTACIAGWASAIGGFSLREFSNSRFMNDPLCCLFDPVHDGVGFDKTHDISTTQAAFALRNYLTTGKPNWPEVLK